MEIAATLLSLAQSYIWCGAVVAALFLTIGLDRIDPDARGAYLFRPLLIPGVLLIWPLVLWRWLREELGWQRHQARHRPPLSTQKLGAVLLAGLIVITLVLSFTVRQSWPADQMPERLSAHHMEATA